MKPNNQRVYIPVKEGDSEMSVSYWERDTHITDVKEQEGYFLTAQELNDYTEKVIKEALNTAAEKVDLTLLKKSQHSKKARWKKVSKKEEEEGVDIFNYEVLYKPSKKSITNQFNNIFNKFKV